ncbi:MAG TPA: hypothetical protein PKC60_06420 [Hydrogenophaga sp.]|mgnify:CR=1 FL=1|uniref:hypothetical protein n=1 Tax=Hydrogenophaga sp. TaxID=1904254 RepID=UPI002C5C85DA|nr:hypothetical protein [Hydrogenophaga sp.]HMN92850.1 hypothetical protein [Hydrogenophaga sp.]HMP11751.1 hypothetical protein [Hydrogenophaga sp.]
MSETIDLISASFAKTEVGQREIQTRSLGLAPLVRRLLVLIDGNKTGRDLAVFAGGVEVEPLLQELLDKGCVEAKARSRQAEPPAPTERTEPDATGSLPDASTRSTSENEMARNFMINTVNTVFGQHSRLTLIETIARAKGTDELRQAYLSWAKAMEEDRIGAKRLPELREKLFKVL